MKCLFRNTFAIITVVFLCGSCSPAGKYADPQKSLERLAKDKDARIGIAVIVDGKDTLSINCNDAFLTRSVHKFPIALAWAGHCRRNRLPSNMPIEIRKEDLRLDTHGPMTENTLASGQPVTDGLPSP